MLCDLAHTTDLSSAGIFTSNTSRAAMLLERAAFQSTGGQRCSRSLVSCCVAHVADALLEAEPKT